MLKKNRVEKLVSPWKEAHGSTYLPCKILLGGISLISTSWKINILTGESIWKDLITEALKKNIKASQKAFGKSL